MRPHLAQNDCSSSKPPQVVRSIFCRKLQGVTLLQDMYAQ